MNQIIVLIVLAAWLLLVFNIEKAPLLFRPYLKALLVVVGWLLMFCPIVWGILRVAWVAWLILAGGVLLWIRIRFG